MHSSLKLKKKQCWPQLFSILTQTVVKFYTFPNIAFLFKGEMIIEDFEVKDVLSMVKFTHNQELPQFCMNSELAFLADKYEITHLLKLCIEMMCQNIHRYDNV